MSAVLVVAVVAAAGSALGRTAALDRANRPTLAAAIAAGAEGACALTTTGGTSAGGYNGEDQLGTGQQSLVASSVPVDVSGLRTGVAALAAGIRHSCALMSAGGVKCWGMATLGQLGDGTAQRRLAPVDVVDLGSGVTAVAGGVESSCRSDALRAVKCWGASGVGQLGDGSKITTTANSLPHRSTPVAVVGFGPQATATINSQSVTVTPARVVPVSVRCSASASCHGRLTLSAARLGKFGAHSFCIRASSTRAIAVRLSTRAFELVVRAKHLSAQARASYEQTPGVTVTTTRTIALTAPTRGR